MEELLCGENCIPSDGMERKRKRKRKSNSSRKGEVNESGSSKGTPSAVDSTGVSLAVSTSLMHEDAASLNEPEGKRKNKKKKKKKKKRGMEKQDAEVPNTDDSPMFVEGPSCASHDSHESSEPVDGSNPVAKKKRKKKKKEMEVTHSNGTSTPAERPDSALQELAENFEPYRKSKKKKKEEEEETEEVEATEQHDTDNSIGGADTALQELEAKSEVDGDLKKKKKGEETEVTHSKETSMPAKGLDSALQELNENIKLSRKSKKKKKEKKEEPEAIEQHEGNNSAGRADSSLQELNEKTAVDGEIKKKLKKKQKQEVINPNDGCASVEGRSPLLPEVNVETKPMGDSNNLIGKTKRRTRKKPEDISAPDKCLTSATELTEMDLENTVECSLTSVHQNGALEGATACLEKNQHLFSPVQAALSVASVETSSICLEEKAGLTDCPGNQMLHDHQQGTTAVVSIGNTSMLETQDHKDNLLQIVENYTSHIPLQCRASNCNGGAEHPEHKIPGEEYDIKDINPPTSGVMVSEDIIMKTIKEEKPQPILKSLLDSSNIQISRKKLLILDLNGLLVDVVPAGGRKPDMVLSGKYVYKRPFVDDFIQFCLNTFAVAVWSSRKRRNIDQLIKFLFGHRNRAKMLFCWDQDHCTRTKYTTIENKDKPLVLKELKRVWEKQGRNLPWDKGEYNESNTLLLDDSPYKALRNPENTAIFPYSYQHTVSGDNSLGPGGDIRVYLEKLALAENVPEFVRQNPFGQGAITRSDPTWDFYEKVLSEGKKSCRSRRRQRVFQSRWDR